MRRGEVQGRLAELLDSLVQASTRPGTELAKAWNRVRERGAVSAAAIGPNMLGHAMLHEELAEPVESHDHAVAAYLPIIQSSMKNSS